MIRSIVIRFYFWLVAFVIFFLILGIGSCAHGLRQDLAMADLGVRDSMAAGDTAVIISGCGNQPIVGYTYCRITEGLVIDKIIKVHVPPAQCRPEGQSCVRVTFRTPDGRELSKNVPRGTTEASFSFLELMGHTTAVVGDRGFYPVVMEVNWVDEQGRDRTSAAEGELRVRVLRSGYESLVERAGDASVAWRWSVDGFVLEMTTALRANASRAVK